MRYSFYGLVFIFIWMFEWVLLLACVCCSFSSVIFLCLLWCYWSCLVIFLNFKNVLVKTVLGILLLVFFTSNFCGVLACLDILICFNDIVCFGIIVFCVYSFVHPHAFFLWDSNKNFQINHPIFLTYLCKAFWISLTITFLEEFAGNLFFTKDLTNFMHLFFAKAPYFSITSLLSSIFNQNTFSWL